MYRLLIRLILISLLAFCVHSSQAQFAIFQVAATNVITCDFLTGNVSGASGPCVNPVAACDGVTDDAAAFASFGSWAMANQGTSRVVLNLPSSATCVFEPDSTQAFWLVGPNRNISSASSSGGILRIAMSSTTGFTTGDVVSISGLTGTPLGNGQHTITVASGTQIDIPAVTFVASGLGANAKVLSQRGVKNLLVQGNGSTIKNTTTQPIQWGSRGISQDNRHSARVATVAAGANAVTLIDSSQTSIFSVGTYAMMGGFNIQDVFQDAFGFPPNFHYFQWVLIAGINPGTGVITFTPPLTDEYKSTWPLINEGTSVEVAANGPAALYFVNGNWDASFEYQNLTIDQTQGQSASAGRSITWRDVTFTGSHCSPPSQNQVWTLINGDLSSCNLEIDKIVTRVVMNNVTSNHIKFQSSSVDEAELSNVTVLTDLTGGPKRITITDATLGVWAPGAYAYGRSDEAVCTNCNVTTLQTGGFLERGTDGAVGMNVFCSMTSGVMKCWNWVNVVGASDNGSGMVRLEVTSTVGLVSGLQLNISNVGGLSGVNGGLRTITVVDGTHIDLLSISFSGSYTGGGVISTNAPRWAVPGTNLFWTGGGFSTSAIFQVVDVTQDSLATDPNFTYVHTSLAGGFPTLPTTSGRMNIQVHPSPKFTCTNCTGAADIVSFSAACAPQAPMWSCQTRSYTGGSTTAQPVFQIWGNLSSLSINVTTPYAGAGTNLFHLSRFDNWSVVNSAGSAVSYAAIVDAKTSGDRVVTLSGVTCNTSPGACSGTDAGLVVPDATKTWFGGVSNSGPQFTNAGTPVGVTVTIQTDQGVVLPYLLKRDLDPASNDNSPMWLNKAA